MSGAPSQHEERRRSTRFKSNLNCDVVPNKGTSGESNYSGIILDVSNTGARLMCPNVVDVGMELTIRLKRPNTFPLRGKVVRKISSFAGQAIVGIRLTQGMFPPEIMAEAKEPTRHNDYPDDIRRNGSNATNDARSPGREGSSSRLHVNGIHGEAGSPSSSTAEANAKDKEAAFIERLMGKRTVHGSAPPPVQPSGHGGSSGSQHRPPGVSGSSGSAGTARPSGVKRSGPLDDGEDSSFSNFEKKYGFKPNPEAQARRASQPTEQGRTKADANGSWRPRDLAPKPDRNLPACLMKLGLGLPCTVDDVKVAYHLRAKMVHPDMGGSVDAFIALYQTYREAILFLETEAAKAEKKAGE